MGVVQELLSRLERTSSLAGFGHHFLTIPYLGLADLERGDICGLSFSRIQDGTDVE